MQNMLSSDRASRINFFNQVRFIICYHTLKKGQINDKNKSFLFQIIPLWFTSGGKRERDSEVDKIRNWIKKPLQYTCKVILYMGCIAITAITELHLEASVCPFKSD